MFTGICGIEREVAEREKDVFCERKTLPRGGVLELRPLPPTAAARGSGLLPCHPQNPRSCLYVCPRVFKNENFPPVSEKLALGLV